MKKILGIAITFILIVGLCGCDSSAMNEKSENTDSVSLYEWGLQVVDEMNEILHSDAYTAMMGSSDEIEKVADELRKGVYEEPQAVYRISFSDKSLETVLQLTESDESFDELSDVMQKEMTDSFYNGIPNLINSRLYGTACLAASSLYYTSITFVSAEAETDMIYLYIYENAEPVMVSYITGEDGTVTATGHYIMSIYDDATFENEEDVKSFINSILYFTGCNVEVVETR